MSHSVFSVAQKYGFQVLIHGFFLCLFNCAQVIHCSATLVADTHRYRRLYDMRQHRQTISFPKIRKKKENPEWREELPVPSCVLSSPLAFAPVAQRPARKKEDKCAPPLRSPVTCPTEYLQQSGLNLILLGPNSFPVRADSSFSLSIQVWISFLGLCSLTVITDEDLVLDFQRFHSPVAYYAANRPNTQLHGPEVKVQESLMALLIIQSLDKMRTNHP